MYFLKRTNVQPENSIQLNKFLTGNKYFIKFPFWKIVNNNSISKIKQEYNLDQFLFYAWKTNSVCFLKYRSKSKSYAIYHIYMLKIVIFFRFLRTKYKYWKITNVNPLNIFYIIISTIFVCTYFIILRLNIFTYFIVLFVGFKFKLKFTYFHIWLYLLLFNFIILHIHTNIIMLQYFLYYYDISI